MENTTRAVLGAQTGVSTGNNNGWPSVLGEFTALAILLVSFGVMLRWILGELTSDIKEQTASINSMRDLIATLVGNQSKEHSDMLGTLKEIDRHLTKRKEE